MILNGYSACEETRWELTNCWLSASCWVFIVNTHVCETLCGVCSFYLGNVNNTKYFVLTCSIDVFSTLLNFRSQYNVCTGGNAMCNSGPGTNRRDDLSKRGRKIVLFFWRQSLCLVPHQFSFGTNHLWFALRMIPYFLHVVFHVASYRQWISIGGLQNIVSIFFNL